MQSQKDSVNLTKRSKWKKKLPAAPWHKTKNKCIQKLIMYTKPTLLTTTMILKNNVLKKKFFFSF